jgi:1-acyl-sn-glycerol-3-phosphate acyltransferase
VAPAVRPQNSRGGGVEGQPGRASRTAARVLVSRWRGCGWSTASRTWRSGCPVVPVACHGTAELRGRAALRPRRPPVLVVVGDPVVLPAAGGVSRRTVAAAADRVRSTLAAHVAATRPRSG